MRRRYFLLFILGLTIGIFFGLKQVSADAPTETSGGETVASVIYDEAWNAIEAVVSSAAGYVAVNFPPDCTTCPDSITAGKIDKVTSSNNGWVATVIPKMLVTKWKVHGHVHFH